MDEWPRSLGMSSGQAGHRGMEPKALWQRLNHCYQVNPAKWFLNFLPARNFLDNSNGQGRLYWILAGCRVEEIGEGEKEAFVKWYRLIEVMTAAAKGA